jgi:hypothetical protein
MGRAWGTNLAPANPLLLTLATDTAVPAGGKTVVLDSGAGLRFGVAAGGGVYLLCDLALVVTLGAGAPSALVITLDLVVAGGNQDTYTVPPTLLTASAVLVISPTLLVPNSGTIWFPAGDRIQITANPTGQAITANAVGTRGLCTFNQGV